MKKTLFVSDLDGTLLTPQIELPEGAAERINRLTACGVMITYATARTVRSVSHILGDIDFTLPGACPIALMNGVLVRDMRESRYIRAAVISRAKAEQIHRAVTSCGLEPFIYTIDNDAPIDGDPMVTYYRAAVNDAMREFMDERIGRYKKPFIRITNTGETAGDIVYFAVLGGETEIRTAAARIGSIEGTACTYYRDAYKPDVWYLEIFDESASKKHAVQYLKTITGADELVCFGDNRNDLPMFEAADTAVAVENAVEEVRAAADFVTGDVVGFIEDYLEKQV